MRLSPDTAAFSATFRLAGYLGRANPVSLPTPPSGMPPLSHTLLLPLQSARRAHSLQRERLINRSGLSWILEAFLGLLSCIALLKLSQGLHLHTGLHPLQSIPLWSGHSPSLCSMALFLPGCCAFVGGWDWPLPQCWPLSHIWPFFHCWPLLHWWPLPKSGHCLNTDHCLTTDLFFTTECCLTSDYCFTTYHCLTTRHFF